MYRVYIYNDMENFTDEDLVKACGMISASRRRKTMEYVNESDRKQSAIAELLLRHALREVFSLDRLPEICYGYHGKPDLSGDGMPEFNLSHCRMAVACAVADMAVGIDVEPYSSYCDEVAREVFSDRELKMAFRNPAMFAELWTRKESYLKYTGEGLSDSLKTLLHEAGDVRFRTFHASAGYACTVCAKTANQDNPTFVDKTALLSNLQK